MLKKGWGIFMKLSYTVAIGSLKTHYSLNIFKPSVQYIYK